MENKICPLLTICSSIASAGHPAVCSGEECAWFYGDRCAVLELAMNTSDIQAVADMIDFHGGGKE